MSNGPDDSALRELLDALERLQELADAERHATLDRMAATQPERAARLRALLDRQAEASRFFDGLERSLGRGLAAELDAAWAPGRRVGPYRLERLLATGGMGAVFLARKADGELKRPVALKLMPPGLLAGEARERIRRERDLLAELAHPNIAPLLDAGVDEEGQPWIAMEYIEGRRFDDWCRAHAADREACVDQLRVLAEAVAFAHRNLVVHGDLKPGNVMVDGQDRVRLLDFGVARMLDGSDPVSGARYMTEAYAAPELRDGRRPRPASDVFALGRMLENLIESTEPGRTRGTRELERIAARATAGAPDHRYESAGAFAEDLRRWRSKEPVSACGGGVAYRFLKRVQRHPWATAGLCAVAVLVLGFGVVSRFQAERFERERDSARQLAAFLEQVFISADPDRSPGQALTAKELLDRGREGLATESLEPSVQARFLSILGRTYQRLGDYEGAGQLLDRALTADTVSDDQRLDLMIERAETDRLSGAFAKAEAGYLEILERIRPGSRDRRARALSGLGRTLAQSGHPGEAISLLEEGLALTRSRDAEDAALLADRLNDYGSALYRLGRFDEAIASLEEAIPLRRRTDAEAGFTLGSPRTATLVSNLALMHYLQGRPERAEPLFREALAMRRSLLPPGHPDLAQTLSNLGLMLKDYGGIEEARSLLAEALAVRRAGLEPGHFRIAQAELNLGIATRESGDHASAADLLIGARDDLMAALGNDHLQVAVAHNEIGTLRLRQGDPVAAEREHRRALQIQRAGLPEGHPHLAWSLLGLGRALAAAGRAEEARRAIDEAVGIRRAHLPADDPLRRDAEQALAILESGRVESRPVPQPERLQEMR
ncbi:serine/threonine-protein kinase [Halomonas denitrificans]|nr:serine/threonine-protein kinase [Halomonas denitrificans]